MATTLPCLLLAHSALTLIPTTSSMFAVSPSPHRHFSNKENGLRPSHFPFTLAPMSPFLAGAGAGAAASMPSSPRSAASTPSAGSSKARASGLGIGIGRAPRRGAGAGHGAKPYDRKASVTRAKKRAMSPVKGGAAESSLGGKGKGKAKALGAAIRDAQTMMKAKTALGPATGKGTQANMAAAARCDPLPAPAASISTTTPCTRPCIRAAKIPLSLPRPSIPPVASLPGVLANIPPVYALHRLTPHLPALLLVASQYVPLPADQYPPPPPPPPALKDGQKTPHTHGTLPFGVPRVLAGDTELGSKLAGREPDVCLAVRDASEGCVPRLMPVNSLVYAAQCSNWAERTNSAASGSAVPRGVELERIEEDDEGSAQGSEGEGVDDVESVDGPAILDGGEVDTGADADADTNMDSPSSFRHAHTHTASAHLLSPSPASSASPAELVTPPSPPAPSLLHLPIIPILISHSPSFPTLHLHLHLPARPLFPALLGLAPEQAAPAHPGVATQLRGMGTADLLRQLEWMRGFWANVCALGVGSDRTWSAMGEAWGVVVGELRRRSMEAQ